MQSLNKKRCYKKSIIKIYTLFAQTVFFFYDCFHNWSTFFHEIKLFKTKVVKF